ncbi:hypothetical protein PtA15_9A416 [Puccinia triticina]|uniref:Uncharacterized protein n=1 Tax=Puccinia triticina TaxID=208348 RepID=A0ABY7CSN9_9BASI|nr:uncharacterized protein PtA15_9A416 [Puccinia triticina]WAQ88289.1 hypothetical protein PtA15_9A416 [Puccinia triticina]
MTHAGELNEIFPLERLFRKTKKKRLDCRQIFTAPAVLRLSLFDSNGLGGIEESAANSWQATWFSALEESAGSILDCHQHCGGIHLLAPLMVLIRVQPTDTQPLVIFFEADNAASTSV